MDWNSIVPVLIGSGVFAQGLGVLTWAVRLELRVKALEQKGMQHG
jgi:hypothetical protein